MIGRFFRPEAPARRKAPVPVVTVSSLTRGGTGKTPTVIALAQRLNARKVHVAMPGPGAPRLVDERGDDPNEVGDEPLLSAAFAPTWIGASAADCADAAARAGAEIVIVEEDDPQDVAGDLRVLVQDAVKAFGNARARPFGPLRVPLSQGLGDADLIVTVGPKGAQARFPAVPLPRIRAQLAPLQTGMSWERLPVLAFAGIGVPERFFATLHDLGADVRRTQALTDHQEMTTALLTRLEREAALSGAQLVTTEKDAVRLPAAFRRKVLVVPVRLETDDWAPFDDLVAERLPRP